MRKKVTVILFGISVFAGLGYLAFAHTPVGKNSLTKWLLKKWNEAAKQKNRELDNDKLKAELKKLKYSDLEVLAAYTWAFPSLPRQEAFEGKTKEKFEKRYKKLVESEILKRADLSALDNIVLPG